jgi:hypothetical protein
MQLHSQYKKKKCCTHPSYYSSLSTSGFFACYSSCFSSVCHSCPVCRLSHHVVMYRICQPYNKLLLMVLIYIALPPSCPCYSRETCHDGCFSGPQILIVLMPMHRHLCRLLVPSKLYMDSLS